MNIQNQYQRFNKRELDVLLSSGEQVTSALISGALNDIGVKSKSWMNWQIPIITERAYQCKNTIWMWKYKWLCICWWCCSYSRLSGISKKGDITTIGRIGSDATAVAIAKFSNR